MASNFKPADDFGGGSFDSDDISDGERGFKTSRGAASDLSRRRFPEYLEPGEDLELIRAYQAGDQRAGNRLTRAYARLVRSCAKKPKPIFGPSHDDVIAAGMAGLAEAMAGFSPQSNNGFTAYAKLIIRGRMLDLARLWWQRGTGDDDASRHLFAHPDATAEEIAKACGITVETAQAGIDGIGRTLEPTPYDDAMDEECAYPEVFAGRYNLAGHLRHADVAPNIRHDRAVWAQLQNVVPRHRGSERRTGDYIVDAAVRAEFLYALQRIKQIGRQGYADELVERDNRPTEYPPRYLRAGADQPWLKAALIEYRLYNARLRAVEPGIADAEKVLGQEREQRKAHLALIAQVGERHQTIQPGRASFTVPFKKMKRVKQTQTKVDDKCPKCKPFMSLLQQSTRSLDADCSPLVPLLPESLAEKSPSESSAT